MISLIALLHLGNVMFCEDGRGHWWDWRFLVHCSGFCGHCLNLRDVHVEDLFFFDITML